MSSNNNFKSLGDFLENDITQSSKLFKKGMEPNKSTAVPSAKPMGLVNLEETVKILQEVNDEKIKKEFEREQREKENNQYLKSLSENVNFIANEFSMVMTNLITINNLMKINNNTLQKIEDQIDTSNKIQAEIFEELVKSNFGNEKERIQTSKKLVTKFSDRVELSANLGQIIQLITQYMQ
ncbi:hypothetical protein HSZ49_09280 [Staphylococcus saprophyticus]|uniref:hypothetical protein n=1 Tax=Staphylococcus saprophyticus TaxID=29385 RepID=UPI00157D7ABB|nr:hypothetical protein [Staphylococcus saprophyticus]QKQ06009.1 hypothetical protein HSZ49_09280 [Staphylococcus saprophyticus]